MSSDANAASPPISFSAAHCSVSMQGSLWVLVNTCINPGDNGPALREGPRPPRIGHVGVSVQGTQLRCPRLA